MMQVAIYIIGGTWKMNICSMKKPS